MACVQGEIRDIFRGGSIVRLGGRLGLGLWRGFFFDWTSLV